MSPEYKVHSMKVPAPAMGYLLMSYGSGRSQRLPKQNRYLSLLMVAYQNWMNCKTLLLNTAQTEVEVHRKKSSVQISSQLANFHGPGKPTND